MDHTLPPSELLEPQRLHPPLCSALTLAPHTPSHSTPGTLKHRGKRALTKLNGLTTAAPSSFPILMCLSLFPTHHICSDIFNRRRKRETTSARDNPSLPNISPTKAPSRKRAVLFYNLKLHSGCSSLLGIGDVDTMDVIQKLVLLY